MNNAGRLRLSTTAWLVTAAFLIRAALPMGWMPMPTESGVRIMLCSGNGAIELSAATQRLIAYSAIQTAKNLHERAHDHGSSPDKGAPRDPCAFGMALAKAFDLPAPPLVDFVIRHVVAPSVLPAVTARLVAARGLRPPARGPPIFA